MRTRSVRGCRRTAPGIAERVALAAKISRFMPRIRRAAFTLALVALALAAPRPAAAHPAPFSYLDVVYRNGGIEGTLVIHVIDAAHELGITPPEQMLDNA